MNELIVQNTNLPDKIEDLSRFVLFANEKLNSVRAEIRAIDKLKLSQEVREQKLEEASMVAEALLDAEVKLGELFNKIPKATSAKGNQYTKKWNFDSDVEIPNSKTEIIKNLGFSQKQAERLETLADNKNLVEFVKAEARENDDIPTKTRILSLASYQKKMEKQCDEYDEYIDFGIKIYKELSKIIDVIDKFEITPNRMEALRENYNDVMTADNQIQFINMAIDKLNLIKVELRKGKKL